MQPPQIPTQRSSIADGETRTGIGEIVSSLREVRPSFAGLERLIRKLIWGLAIGGALYAVLSVWLLAQSLHNTARLGELTEQLNEAARSLQTVREEQAQTQRKVDAVDEKVEQVQAETPTVELRVPDGGVNRRPTAVVILKPKAPTLPKDAGPAVEVPIVLPPGSRVEDGGAP